MKLGRVNLSTLKMIIIPKQNLSPINHHAQYTFGRWIRISSMRKEELTGFVREFADLSFFLIFSMEG